MTRPHPTTGSTVEAWTRGLARANGAPGGGAAAAVMLAVAAALMAMVAGYTRATAEISELDIDRITRRAEELRGEALQLADDDASASAAFGAAFALTPGPQRENAVRKASLIAAESSGTIGRRAIDALSDIEWLCTFGNPALIADTTVALAALRAAMIGAHTNADFDLRAATSRQNGPETGSRISRLSDDLSRLGAAIEQIENLTALAGARFDVPAEPHRDRESEPGSR